MDLQIARGGFDGVPSLSVSGCARRDPAVVREQEGSQEPRPYEATPHIPPHTLDTFQGAVSIQHSRAVGVVNLSD